MRGPTLATILFLAALVAAGCTAPPSPSGTQTPRAEECPLAPPGDSTQSALRVTAKVAPEHEQIYGTDRAGPYDKGEALLRWNQAWQDQKPLKPSGCATFTVPKSAAPLQVHVRVPDKESPSGACFWGGAETVSDLSGPTYDVVVEMLLGCS